MSLLSKYRRTADKLLADYNHARQQVRDEKAALEQARIQLEQAITAQQIIQNVAQRIQQEAHSRVASIVTKCLQAIGYDYEFKVIFERKRGKTEARLVFMRGENEVNPRECGGALDVASFGLRLACLMLSRPAPRRLLVLDEPFKQVGKPHSERIGELLSRLSKDMEVQIVLVTHNQALRIGSVIDLGEGEA